MTEHLSVREAEILGLVATGLTNKEIAERLGISANTLKSHLRRCYQKLGVATRDGAIAWYVVQRGAAEQK